MTRTVAVVGEFDGLHVGHQRHINVANRMGGWRELPYGMLLHRGDCEEQLMTLDERLAALERSGVKTSVVIDATTSREEVEQQLREAIDALNVGTAVLACAPGAPVDPRWGSLRPLLHARDVETVEVPRLFDENGRAVTSDLVRARLAAGAVDEVASLLGRRVAVTGVVEHGDARGRTIGFPTANLRFRPLAVWPALGVYAAWITIDGRRRQCAVNVGTRPTVYGNDGVTLLEAHVLDFSGDLYGRVVEVEFVARLRGERRFSSLDELKAQLARDVEETRMQLSAVASR